MIEQTAVERAIASVDDPCSMAANAPLNIFELGLVRDWSVDDDGVVRVTVSPTAPGCILMGSIVDAIRERAQQVPGVADVRVEVDSTFVWSPELMSEEGREILARRRAESLRLMPLRPHQWESERP